MRESEPNTRVATRGMNDLGGQTVSSSSESDRPAGDSQLHEAIASL